MTHIVRKSPFKNSKDSKIPPFIGVHFHWLLIPYSCSHYCHHPKWLSIFSKDIGGFSLSPDSGDSIPFFGLYKCYKTEPILMK